MRNRLVRITVVAVVLVIAGLALSADEPRTNLTSEQLWELIHSPATTAELDRREARLEAELAEGDTPEWAGTYYRGDGLGLNVSVTLAPHGGFAYTWTGCLGRYDANYGRVHEANGRIALDAELPARGRGIAREYVLVLWSGRHYLVGVDQAKEFVNAVNAGREPCDGFCVEFLLRRGDESIVVDGHPALPEEWRAWLLEQPIEAGYLETLETSVEPDEHATPDYPYSWRRSRLRIGAGSRQGVWPGMTFFDTAPESTGIEYTVVEVGADASIVRAQEMLTADPGAAPRAPAALSTRMYRPVPVLRWTQ
jgi:hypothetical protein